MDVEQFRAFVAAHEWVFAKSMPHIPHFYVSRDKALAEEQFEAAVAFIRANGEERPWGRGKPLTYVDVDGFTYWTMGSPIPATRIINRKVEGTSMSPPGRSGP